MSHFPGTQEDHNGFAVGRRASGNPTLKRLQSLSPSTDSLAGAQLLTTVVSWPGKQKNSRLTFSRIKAPNLREPFRKRRSANKDRTYAISYKLIYKLFSTNALFYSGSLLERSAYRTPLARRERFLRSNYLQKKINLQNGKEILCQAITASQDAL